MTTKTTYHRDGSVTLWNVYTQTRQRFYPSTRYPVSERILASLSYEERERVERHMRRAQERAGRADR